jgi:hypothetical protein
MMEGWQHGGGEGWKDIRESVEVKEEPELGLERMAKRWRDAGGTRARSPTSLPSSHLLFSPSPTCLAPSEIIEVTQLSALASCSSGVVRLSRRLLLKRIVRSCVRM